jgi:hypothetical protein
MAAGAPSQSEPSVRPGLAGHLARSLGATGWDAALAVGLCLTGFAVVLLGSHLSPQVNHFSALGAALLLAMTLPLIVVRSHSWIAFAVIAGASVLGAVFDQNAINVGYAGGAIALFFVASRNDIWHSLLAGMLASLTLIAIFGMLFYRGDATIWLAIASWFVFSAVWLAGVVLRAYRESVREARERASA